MNSRIQTVVMEEEEEEEEVLMKSNRNGDELVVGNTGREACYSSIEEAETRVLQSERMITNR